MEVPTYSSSPTNTHTGSVPDSREITRMRHGPEGQAKESKELTRSLSLPRLSSRGSLLSR